MNNVFVYCEIDKFTVEEVSYELLTKGRKLANELGVQLEAIAAGNGITGKSKKKSFLTELTNSTCSMPKDFTPILQNPIRVFSSTCSNRNSRKSA